MPDSTETSVSPEASPRRGFLRKISGLIMTGGLVGGYGALAALAGRFLYPGRKPENWQFVATLDRLDVGQSMGFRAPSGERIVVARRQKGDTAECFVALSSICPHLGCAVHWESNNNRFFCPCHNGVFDSAGKATEGPPAAAGQSLGKFPLKVESGLLYIAVSSNSIQQSRGA